MKPIDELEQFLTTDMWYAFNNEFKNEIDMIKYLKKHFKICKKQIKEEKK